jgi:hypothetical protein
MRKMGVLQLALQLTYLYVVSVIGQVAKVARIATCCIYGATHYNSITTLLQQLVLNYYETPL